MIKNVLLYFCVIISLRSCATDLLGSASGTVSDEHCISLATSTTYRQILFDEIRFLKILLQRLTSAGLTTIKPEHLNRTLLLASSPEVETGTLEFTRQHLLNAILENPAARNELEYVYVSRQDGFHNIVNLARNKMRRFEDKAKLENTGANQWQVLVKIFDQCKKNENINEYLIRAEVSEFMNFQRWNLIANNFHEDFKTNKFCE